MTPGSYNTTMGVIKTIRMFLKPIHQVFIVEMGAKQHGDITEICDLVQPSIGILTAVAEQHLDTFKTLENVKQTKFELIRALPKKGSAFLNAEYEIIKNEPVSDNTCKTYYSANSAQSDYYANDFSYTQKGMRFSFYKKGEKLIDLETKLLGNHNVSNIVASCAVAYQMGVPTESIRFAVKNLEPVEHRLEIKQNTAGITIIDDAFNSNPSGATMALEVLKQMQGNQKIIVTPGMIELGDKEFFYNKKFGEQISEVCDLVVLVGPKQTIPIAEGLK
jgi:UDP-N-acetylmuramoyl-tripeptide--D-alanyl-D-alanine ligase